MALLDLYAGWVSMGLRVLEYLGRLQGKFTDYFFSQLFFHLLQSGKQIEGGEVVGELGGGIVKVRLVGKAIGLGFV